MAGSIRQRGRNSWQIRVYAGTDAESGQRKQLTRTVQGSRTQAQRELRSLAAFANVGPSVGARTTLGELLDRWFAANEAGWATTTVRSSWSIIDRQLRPKLGHILVRDLTTVMIDEFYASLRVDGAVEGGPLTPGSVRRIHGVLHRALAQAMRWEWIWSNPAASASPPRTDPVEMRPPLSGAGWRTARPRQGAPPAAASLLDSGRNNGCAPRSAPCPQVGGRRFRTRELVVPTLLGRGPQGARPRADEDEAVSPGCPRSLHAAATRGTVGPDLRGRHQ